MPATLPALDFNTRRKALRMPVAALVLRSGVPSPVVARILRGKTAAVRFGHVERVAEALGMPLGGMATDDGEFRARQARAKARLLVRLTQGTMALESQGLPDDVLADLEAKAFARLLADDGRVLWGE